MKLGKVIAGVVTGGASGLARQPPRRWRGRLRVAIFDVNREAGRGAGRQDRRVYTAIAM